MQLIARAVAATGVESVTLKVYADNLAAVSLYESLGFRRDASKHGGDSFLMRMPVSDSKASRALRFAILGNSGSG